MTPSVNTLALYRAIADGAKAERLPLIAASNFGFPLPHIRVVQHGDFGVSLRLSGGSIHHNQLEPIIGILRSASGLFRRLADAQCVSNPMCDRSAKMSQIDKLATASEVDVGFLFGLGAHEPILVHLDERMYSVKRDVASNWVWHAFRGFKILQQSYEKTGFVPRTFAAIGSGSGVDAIGAARIFKTLTTILVTDVEPDIVERATANVRRNVPESVKVIGLCGDVCEPIRTAGYKVDLVYANLPNIPTSLTGPIDHGTFYRGSGDNHGRLVLSKYLLTLQYRFLETARNILAPCGEATFMIGGRFPLEVLNELATATSFKLREVLATLKAQTEAENVALGYAEWESGDVRFDFYRYPEVSHLVGSDAIFTGQQLKARIAPFAISAKAAVERVRAGAAVAHTLHMMAGQPSE